MNVAFAYEYPADDIEVRSGHPYFILDQLEQRAEVRRVFPLSRRSRYRFAPKLLLHRLAGRTYLPDREPGLLKSYARQIARELEGSGADCVFAPDSTVLTCLDTDIPKIFCADATFANVVDAYDDYRNCAPSYVDMAHAQEAQALAACSAAIYPSAWAAQSAIEHYGAVPEKVHVLPFGANLRVPPRKAVASAIGQRRFNPMRLLFVGREWWRKGADVVLEACHIARHSGVRLTLDIVGIEQAPETLPPFVRSHGTLHKSDPNERRRLEALLAEAHLLFVPSRAENYGIAFSEAAAYGVPSLTSDVGGIPTVVRQDVSGFALPAGSSPEHYASVICDCAHDDGRYRELAHSSRHFYDQNLSWDLFGERLMAIVGAAGADASRGLSLT
jgi:glycosyltransferase involved in cell wall biosynthesis